MSAWRKVGGLLACALLVLVACVGAFAQASPEGKIVGVVKDAAGAVVPGASVVVLNEATNVKYTTTASAEGAFVVPSMPAGSYSLTITAKGFAKAVYSNVSVEPSRERSFIATLKIGTATETIEVKAGQELVNTTSSEVSSTITPDQVQNLPLNGRDIISLISTQAGIGTSGRTSTLINGTRPSWSQVTLDGINIQDIYIRTNALDYIPNRPTTDTVSEFTISSAGQGVDAALGANGVRMITPAGTNKIHGRVYEYNRNNAYAANTWFNDHANPVVPLPFYNRNEFGGNASGPIIKDKLFFFGSYVGNRIHEAAQSNLAIPAHDDYLQGVFRYNSGGTVQAVNIMTLAGMDPNAGGCATPPCVVPMAIDPKMQSIILSAIPGASHVNNYQAGDSSATGLLNTAGFRYNQRNTYRRDNEVGKADYELSEKHHFDFTYNRLYEFTDRPDADPLHFIPWVWNDTTTQLFSGGWRYKVNNNLINTVRIGANLAPAPFNVNPAAYDTGFYIPMATSTTPTAAGGLDSPQANMLKQGRNPAVHQYMDDATWVKGNHFFSFGGQFQQQKIYSWYDGWADTGGIIPTITTGFSRTAPADVQLTNAQFPGTISSTDVATANAYRAFLGGIISQVSQTFNVATPTSGFVNGATQARNFSLNDLMFYAQDKWRVKSNLTITYGVKWEYISPYKEDNGMITGPLYADPRNPVDSLMITNGSVGFLKRAWKPDYNNFGPTIGFAYDPFKNGKTSIRGGYTLAFVNDEIRSFAANAADGNPGISATSTQVNLYQTLNSGIPTVSTPAFKMPRTYADQLALSPTSVVWALDPNVRTPMVHEFNLGVERELPKNMAFSVRYVGNFGRSLLRGVDYNQNKAPNNADYMADFNRARTNGYLAVAAGKPWSPFYNATVPGSQQLTYFPTITAVDGYSAYSYLNYNSTVRGWIQQGRAADLANWFVQNGDYFNTARSIFLPNPGIYAIDYGTNGAYSDYNGLQAEVRRRMSNGLQFQANYTWSKVLSNTPTQDNSQTRFNPYLDNARPWLNRARADIDLRHAFKVNTVYELPFGKGKMFLNTSNPVASRIVGGWQLSGIYTWQSGNPFSILAGRGTFNRRSGDQTAQSTLTQDQIRSLLGVRVDPKTGYVFYIDPSVLNPNNAYRGVSPDNLTNTPASNFPSQIFFNPMAGQVGNLGLLAFDGPAFQGLDLGLSKTTRINERINTTLRFDAFNALNHPVFYIGDRDINNATNFGRITTTNIAARQLQFGLRVDF